MNNLYICAVCGAQENKSTFFKHIKTHNYTKQSYYDTFIDNQEHKCPICSKKLKWYERLNYYSKTCGDKNCTKKQRVNEIKNTNKNKYGCEYSFQADTVKEKIKYTLQEKYGVDNPSKISNWAEKVKETNNKKYGADWFSQTNLWVDDVKITCNEKYGVDWWYQSDACRDSLTECCSQLGVENVSQSPIIASKKYKAIKYNDISFKSKAELKVYKFCIERNIKIEYEPIKLEYEDCFGYKHFYIPDFRINGKLYEIKGDHLWKDGHLYFPFRNIDEKQLSIIDERDKAKTQCMIDNDVVVILYSQLEYLSDIIT